MIQTPTVSTNEVAERREAFIERMLESTAGVFDIFTIYLGSQLGLYDALSGSDTLTSVELAEHTGTHERYIREWLEQQTVAGILEVGNPDASPKARRYCLPLAYVEPLVERDSLDYLAPLAQLVVGAVSPLEQIVYAYRNGGGVPLDAYGQDMRDGQAGINRASFLQLIGSEWLPAMPAVHSRLHADPPAHVADIGCGYGWSSIGIAQSYPKAYVDGFDLDEPSIEAAYRNAREAGLTDRLTFHVRDASDPTLAGRYDLVTAFECVHDMSNPVGALRTMRRLVNGTGAVLIVDERVGERFTPTGNDVEWMMYGWSVLHCLPVGMAGEPSAGTGTVMRTDTLRGYAQEAGFSNVEVLPIDNFFFRFYRLIP